MPSCDRISTDGRDTRLVLNTDHQYSYRNSRLLRLPYQYPDVIWISKPMIEYFHDKDYSKVWSEVVYSYYEHLAFGKTNICYDGIDSIYYDNREYYLEKIDQQIFHDWCGQVG